MVLTVSCFQYERISLRLVEGYNNWPSIHSSRSIDELLSLSQLQNIEKLVKKTKPWLMKTDLKLRNY